MKLKLRKTIGSRQTADTDSAAAAAGDENGDYDFSWLKIARYKFKRSINRTKTHFIVYLILNNSK